TVKLEKSTIRLDCGTKAGSMLVMAGRGEYDEGWAVSHALDLIGERWALLIVRELLLGPKRFTDLRAGVSGASPDVLAQRLRGLRAPGVGGPRTLRRVRCASRSPSLPHDAEPSVDSLVLSLRSLFDPRAARGFRATVALRIGDDRFSVRIADGSLQLARGEAERPDPTPEAASSPRGG